MLGAETARYLKNIFEVISECEIIIEGQRQALCHMSGFAPYSAFCRIDRNATECIDSFAVSRFLQDNGVSGKIGDCAKLIRFFDSDEDGILSYNDFIQMVLPCDDNGLRADVQRRPYNRVGRFDALPIEMELGLVRLI